MPALLTKLCHHTAAGGSLLHQFPAAWVVDARLEPRKGRAEDLVSERRRERLRDHLLCHSAHGRRSVNGTAKCGGDGSGGDFGDGPGASGEDEDGGGGGGDADAQRAHVHPTESCEDSSRVRCMARLSLIAMSRRNRSVSMASVEHEARRRRADESSDILAAPLNTQSRASGCEQAKQSAFFFRHRQRLLYDSSHLKRLGASLRHRWLLPRWTVAA